MATSTEKKTVVTPSGASFGIAPGYENPVSAETMFRRRDEWYARNRHLLEGYSSERFIEQKRLDAKKGLA